MQRGPRPKLAPNLGDAGFMKLTQYLARIGYVGSPKEDLRTLRAIHRAHAEAISYENLDILLHQPVSRSVPAIYEKIVERRRGGWCYEMNGLLSWALEEIGFKVIRLAGGVHRQTLGDRIIGNHLVILVELDETWLADVGFGDGLIEPVRLRQGAFRVGPLNCRLDRIEGGWWRYSNDPIGSAPSFDFHRNIADEQLLEAGSRRLQTDARSPFVQNVVVQRWRKGEHFSLRGRALSRLSISGKNTTLIDDVSGFVETLRDVFDIDLPEAASLWPAICARHEALSRDATMPR